MIGYGDSDALAALVANVSRYKSFHPILIAFNPSTSFTSPPTNTSPVEVVVLPRNLGYAAALNAAWRSLAIEDFDAVFIVTADVTLSDEQTLQLETQLNSGDLAAVGPALRFGVGAISYGGYISSSGRVGHFRSGQERAVDWVDGACVLIRADALAAVLPLPEELFLYCEDVLLGARLKSLGLRVGVCNEVIVQQETGRRSRPLLFGYLETRNRLWLTKLVPELGSKAAVAQVGIKLACAVPVGLLPFPKRSWARRRLVLVGRILGFLAGLRNESGPPPNWILRRSGVSNT